MPLTRIESGMYDMLCLGFDGPVVASEIHGPYAGTRGGEQRRGCVFRPERKPPTTTRFGSSTKANRALGAIAYVVDSRHERKARAAQAQGNRALPRRMGTLRAGHY